LIMAETSKRKSLRLKLSGWLTTLIKGVMAFLTQKHYSWSYSAIVFVFNTKFDGKQ
jgi:hypothetical protein